MKIYGGEDYLEGLLAGELGMTLRKAHQDGILARWFFIRYRDPDFHVRLRLEGGGPNFLALIDALQNKYFESLLRKHAISGYRTDNYIPEYSRYGGRVLMQDVETIFLNDSTYCISILRKARESKSDELIWRAALCGTLDYMNCFGISWSQARSFVSEQRKLFLNEMDVGKMHFDALGSLYKKHRKYLEAVVSDLANAEPVMQRALDTRRLANEDACRSIVSHMSKEDILIFLPSIIHMQANRLFTGNSRPQELVIWDFLDRALRSVAARSNGVRSVSRQLVQEAQEEHCVQPV